MYFTVEEENLICLYHNADRRRTAARPSNCRETSSSRSCQGA